jgi:hypothetical protein
MKSRTICFVLSTKRYIQTRCEHKRPLCLWEYVTEDVEEIWKTT